MAIYQFIATHDTDGTPLWRDCDADEYTNYAKDMRRVVRVESDNAPVEMCKCRQLGDWKDFHHPLCNESRSVAEWLDERRDCTVSEVFHDVMDRITYATRDAAPSDAHLTDEQIRHLRVTLGLLNGMGYPDEAETITAIIANGSKP